MKREIAEFVEACRVVARHGLVRCSSGNLSCRLGDDRVLIKASRAWMADVTAADVSVCRLSDGALLGGRAPSVELGLHLGTLRGRPEMNVALHFQSPFATALACRRGPPPDYHVLPEIAYYIGEVVHVPYHVPGSPALAKAVSDAMSRCDLAQLTSHGQTTVAKNYALAIQNACFFELACEIIVRNGGRGRTIPRGRRPQKGSRSGA